MQNHRTTTAAKLIASASIAFAIFTGLAACQDTGNEITVGAAPAEVAAAPRATAPDRADDFSDDGGGLPADGALLAAAQQAGDPSAFVTKEAETAPVAETTDPTDPVVEPSTTASTAPVAAPAATVPAPTTTAPAPPPPPVAAPAPAPTGGGASGSEAAFLACVRARESGGNYSVVSANGLYYGAYQFARSTWDTTASHAGRGDLVGVPPNTVGAGDQDAMALHLYRWQGSAPWGGYC